jgi:hypothetical protein
MPFLWPKMNSRIFGFQRLVWCPKWTPASRSSFIVTAVKSFLLSKSRRARRFVDDDGRAPPSIP